MKNNKKMKIITILLLIIISQSCESNKFKSEDRKETEKNYLSKEDSIRLEKDILNYKNILFSYLYNDSKKQTYKKKGLLVCDTLKDLTHLYNSNTIDLRWVGEDKNRDKLLQTWLAKEEYYVHISDPPEIPDGSLDLTRALDFYNSKELNVFIDSLRRSEYKKILKEINNGNGTDW